MQAVRPPYDVVLGFASLTCLQSMSSRYQLWCHISAEQSDQSGSFHLDSQTVAWNSYGRKLLAFSSHNHLERQVCSGV